MSIVISDKSVKVKPQYSLDPRTLEFGRIFAPNMLSVSYMSGAWGQATLGPIEDFSLHPAALVFHYGQAIFEGMKAYRMPDGSISMFRPELNIRRFNMSAERMDMPQLPPEFFIEGLRKLLLSNQDFLPERPGVLYIRPTMIATEACLGVRSATEFLFYIIVLPSGSYFKTDVAGAGAVDVLVEEHTARAARGGTGNVKAAANYAISLKTIREAKDIGCSQVLFLDAQTGKYVEELGGMNVFFSDGKKLFTPSLTDTILPGVTRQSIIELGPKIGIPVEQRRIEIKEVIEGVRSGDVTEAFACGTAAVCTGLRSLKISSSGELLTFSSAPGPVTSRVYSNLTDIQFGLVPDEFGWTYSVK